MTCAELETTLCDYVDGILDGEPKATVESHLAECATCAELARDAQAALTFMERVPAIEPPDELVTRLLFEAPTSRDKTRRSGIKDLLSRWVQPVLQPRFAMGMAMTILSFSLLGRYVGISDRQIQASDLHPVAIWETVEDRMARTWDGVVRYYENLRVVYQIQSRLSEWSEEQPTSSEPDPALPDLEGIPNRPSADIPAEPGERNEEQ